MGTLGPEGSADSSGSAPSDGTSSFFPERDLFTAVAPLLPNGHCASCGDREKNLNQGIAVLRQLIATCPVCGSPVCAKCAIESTSCTRCADDASRRRSFLTEEDAELVAATASAFLDEQQAARVHDRAPVSTCPLVGDEVNLYVMRVLDRNFRPRCSPVGETLSLIHI